MTIISAVSKLDRERLHTTPFGTHLIHMTFSLDQEPFSMFRLFRRNRGIQSVSDKLVWPMGCTIDQAHVR